MKNYIVNHLTKGLILITGAVIATGCSRDFLDPDPLSFYEPGKTFKLRQVCRLLSHRQIATCGSIGLILNEAISMCPSLPNICFRSFRYTGKPIKVAECGII